LVAGFGTDHFEKAAFVISAFIFFKTCKWRQSEIEKNLIDQQPSPFKRDFQYFVFHSTLKWRKSGLEAA